MQNPMFNKTQEILEDMLKGLENEFEADFICIDGPIAPDLVGLVRDAVEMMKADKASMDKLCIILTTDGGDANTTERLAKIFRHYYAELYYIIPDHAYSAGTILCMSGDRIYMNYSSVLGPIDPQVQNKEGRFVPALGYLEKIKDMLDKAENGTLSEAEFYILKDFDLAELSLYEQARDLTTDLLEEWLVKYKFRNWNRHRSTGEPVTEEEKRNRAKKIAENLSDYKRWKSHGRPLDMETIRSLKLEVDDFGENKKLEKQIMDFHYMLEDYMREYGSGAMLFCRRRGKL